MSVFLAPIGYSWVQLGFSECLSPLPYLLGLSAVVGLTLGCFVTHWSSSVGFPNVLIGPLLTLLASILSWKFNWGRKELTCACPVLTSAFGVNTYVSRFYGVPYVTIIILTGLSEFLMVFLISRPLLVLLEGIHLLDTITSKTKTFFVSSDYYSNVTKQE